MDLTPFQGIELWQAEVENTLCCNAFTAFYGLSLTAEEGMMLAQTHTKALSATGRIEFFGGITEKLIRLFCDSPYLHQKSYVSTLQELMELFYYYKNETEDRIDDDELLLYMKQAFDGVCAGSTGLLGGRELPRLVRRLRGMEEDEDELSAGE